ncbi:ATP-binding protein [Pseudotamlana agarivorans]|uniref:ATP-binding protein n=1 Tax=Pseudotamlana agarivorans TaxID=481183 RepID=UPI00082B3536|nr:sensor histidine kinase [Tamlana agarivorans]
MKKTFLIISLLLYGFSHAQNDIDKRHADALKKQIDLEVNKPKKLQLLDSLATFVWKKKVLPYDSISRIAIDFAVEIDSFNSAAYNTTNLINYYNNYLGKPKEGLAVFTKYFNIFKGQISDQNMACLFIDSGDSYYFIKEKDSALLQYDKAIEYAKKANNERLLATAKLYQGYAYTDEGDFVNASKTLQEVSKIFIKLKDTSKIVSVKNSLSILYSYNGFSKEGQQERREAISLAEKANDHASLTTFYFNQAFDNKKEGLEKERLKNLHKSLTAVKKTNRFNYFKPIIFTALASAYAENDSIKKAKWYLKKVEEDKENTEGIYEHHYYKALKKIAFAERKYAEAEQLGLKHLKIVTSSNQIENIQLAQAFLAKVYEKLNKLDLAYKYYKIYKKSEDSILSVRKTKALAYYQTLYETAKRDQQITEQNTQIELLDEQNKRKQQVLWFGGLSLIALFTIIYLWRSYKFSQRKSLLEKTFAQDLIRNIETERKRISSELHDSVGQSLLLIKNKIFLNSENKTDTGLVDGAIEEIRTISQQLHPFQFEQLGLIKSIKNTVENFQQNSEIFYSENIEITESNIPKDSEIFVFRMIQECLNNVEKHSQAKACNITIEVHKKMVWFQIKDNGIGFDITENSKTLNSLGMKTLKERAQIINAQIHIESVKTKGTTVLIKVPKEK